MLKVLLVTSVASFSVWNSFLSTSSYPFPTQRWFISAIIHLLICHLPSVTCRLSSVTYYLTICLCLNGRHAFLWARQPTSCNTLVCTVYLSFVTNCLLQGHMYHYKRYSLALLVGLNSLSHVLHSLKTSVADVIVLLLVCKTKWYFWKTRDIS